MEVNKLNPIIFIPGLMGSIGGEMLENNARWSFGVAGFFYNPFIKDLEKLGYTLNENLFICYYDWRRNCQSIVKEFLQPLLRTVEKKYPNYKIDLLCHSMGGLVARTYIQGTGYTYNVRNLMVFGTPNKGNVEAYYTWSFGNVIKDDSKEKDIFQIIRRGYIWLIGKILDIPLGIENIEKLHRDFKGLGDLLPSDDYGEILCYKTGDNYYYIPREYTLYTNRLLNHLNENIHILNKRTENIYCFIGTNNSTDESLILDTESLINYRKGYVIGSLKTNEGDGTVTINSATISGAKEFIIEGSHSGILKDSIKYITDIYNLDKSLIDKNMKEPRENPLGIVIKKHVNIHLKNYISTICRSIDGKIITDHDCIFHEFGKDYIWIMFRDIPKGEYILEVLEKYEEDHNIYIIGPNIEKEFIKTNFKKNSSNIFYSSFKT